MRALSPYIYRRFIPMRNVYRAAIAVAALALSVPASATVTVTPSSADSDGSFSIGFSGANVARPSFTESFTFSTTTSGFLSAIVSTTGGGSNSRNDVDFTSVFITGPGNVTYVLTPTSNSDINETRSFDDIFVGIGSYTLTTTGTLRGTNGAYGGNIAFNAAAVPEPATWGLMVLGFGMIGAAARGRKVKTNVKFA
ncbi:PEP-CTERM sorting domain-containing protein [Sphingomonas aliaeris]|uniref:PEP-CTERM sorting domain-containing protein n=1 Tax=Sphingomonas aliaeris TaxID=2759526 RepID=A0A974S5I5_9SPHN|nr:FxDxF family PEP-CTERM protein [Sphingomonas aliaeris]QQV78733.1 PEP-CTERM sorting domain-containing protein [Sphingomonas aliaeris]